jgi:hypothetical protein
MQRRLALRLIYLNWMGKKLSPVGDLEKSGLKATIYSVVLLKSDMPLSRANHEKS